MCCPVQMSATQKERLCVRSGSCHLTNKRSSRGGALRGVLRITECLTTDKPQVHMDPPCPPRARQVGPRNVMPGAHAPSASFRPVCCVLLVLVCCLTCACHLTNPRSSRAGALRGALRLRMAYDTPAARQVASTHPPSPPPSFPGQAALRSSSVKKKN
jgi:hypothetical protein